MVRATASSPFDKPHLRTLSIGRDLLQKQNLKDLNKGHSFPTTRTRPNNQWVWWKHQDADPPTKKLTASKDRTPNCCTDAASTQTVDSIQDATSERDQPQKQKSNGSQQRKHQSKDDNSIKTDRSSQTSTQTRCWSAPRSTSKQLTDLHRNSWQHPSITWRKNLQHRKV